MKPPIRQLRRFTPPTTHYRVYEHDFNRYAIVTAPNPFQGFWKMQGLKLGRSANSTGAVRPKCPRMM